MSLKSKLLYRSNHKSVNRLIKWFGVFLFNVYNVIYKRIPGVRAYVFLIDKEQCKVVLVKNWLNNGRWALPGGGAKKSERALQACLREVKEEINLDLEANRLERVYSVQLHKPQRRLVFYRYFMPECQLQYRILELTDAQWFDWQDKAILARLSPEPITALKKATADL